jgi:CxxC-x17-CxxC domain-containing protein
MPDDKILACAECGLNFVFSAREQEVHAHMGYAHQPKRCPPCRVEARKRRLPPGTAHITLCISCGVEVALPYVPAPGRSVLCDACRAAR